MSRLQQTEGLTDDQTEILKAVREFVEARDPPGRHRARAPRRVPDRDRRGPQGARHLRADDPRGVRRAGRVAAHLRAVRRGDRPRLDERQRHHQHPLHRRLHADPARHRGAEAEVPAADGDRRGPRRVLDVASRAAAPTSRAIKTKAVAATATAYVINGQKMWLTNGGSSNLVAVLVKTDEGAGLGLPEHDDVPGGEGGRLRRDRPGRHHPRQDREDGLQGRRHHRAGLRGPPDRRRPDPRRRAGQGLLPDDGRRRGRPRQRRRPRLRGRQPGLRARHRLRPAARDVRQEDRRAPGGAVPARRDGDQGRGRARR